MKSKYLTIKPSTVYADDKGDFFPDIFSFPISKLKVSTILQKYTLTKNDIDRFDVLMYRFYGMCDYSDLVLWYNQIADLSECEPGRVIYLLPKQDIETFYRENIL